MPGWFWFLTMVVGVGSIAISAGVVTVMKIAEIDVAAMRPGGTKPPKRSFD